MSDWNDFNQQESTFLFLVLGLFPFGIVIKIISVIFSVPLNYLFPLVVIWGLTLMFFGLKRSMRECPRCHQLFYSKKKFATACTHCGAEPLDN